jgi:hypothetical protein
MYTDELLTRAFETPRTFTCGVELPQAITPKRLNTNRNLLKRTL